MGQTSRQTAMDMGEVSEQTVLLRHLEILLRQSQELCSVSVDSHFIRSDTGQDVANNNEIMSAQNQNIFENLRLHTTNDGPCVQDVVDNVGPQAVTSPTQELIFEPVQENVFGCDPYLDEFGSLNSRDAIQETTPQIKLEPPETPPTSELGCSQNIRSKLRKSIVVSRKARGEGEIPDLYAERKPFQLTEVDIEKRERRKEQNRRAASKFRTKKKEKLEKAVEEVQEALRTKEDLEREVITLRHELSRLVSILNEHFRSGCCVLPEASYSVSLVVSEDAQNPDCEAIVSTSQDHLPSPPASPDTTGISRAVTASRAVLVSTPVHSPAKRPRFSDTQVVPSISPSLVTMEMSPRIPHPSHDTVYESSPEVPVTDTAPDSHVVSPKRVFNFDHVYNPPTAVSVSDPAFSLSTPASNTHSAPNFLPKNKNPGVHPLLTSNNNLPSWELPNLQPMNLPGLVVTPPCPGPVQASGRDQQHSQHSQQQNLFDQSSASSTSSRSSSLACSTNKPSVAECSTEPTQTGQGLGSPLPYYSPPARCVAKQTPMHGDTAAPSDPSVEPLAPSREPPNLKPHQVFRSSSRDKRIKKILQDLLSPTESDVNINDNYE